MVARPAGEYDGAAVRARAAIMMRSDPERGQSTVEWLALMAMFVAIAGVLVTSLPSVGDAIAGTFRELIAKFTP